MEEWSDKNELSPDEITYMNRTNVWWQCKKCGKDYQAVIYAKANGRVCPFCTVSEIQKLREHWLAKKKINKDFGYLLPQLATIYYAGKEGLQVYPDTEFPTGMLVTAYIPGINLIVDMCDFDTEIKVKAYISEKRGIKYVSMPERLPEEEIITRIRKAFATVSVFPKTPASEDLKHIRDSFFQWKEAN
jgi:hypothetical protein